MQTRKPHYELALCNNWVNVNSAVKELYAFALKQKVNDARFIVALAGYYDQNETLLTTNRGILDASMVATIMTFRLRGEKIYKIARNFGEQLHRTAKLDISGALVPLTNSVCIEFPDSIRFKMPATNDSYAHCAYVYTIDDKNIRIEQGEGIKTLYRAVQMLVPHYTGDGTLLMRYDRVGLVFTDPKESIETVIERSMRASTSPFSVDMAHYVMKCLMYIHSGDPDLRAYRAPRAETQNPKKLRRFAKDHANQSLVNMTLVGYDFKKGVVYTKDETSVTGHFRWQPYGPARMQVKLIWIDEHVRHFKTEG
jgi:hypothetical protein